MAARGGAGGAAQAQGAVRARRGYPISSSSAYLLISYPISYPMAKQLPVQLSYQHPISYPTSSLEGGEW